MARDTKPPLVVDCARPFAMTAKTLRTSSANDGRYDFEPPNTQSRVARKNRTTTVKIAQGLSGRMTKVVLKPIIEK